MQWIIFAAITSIVALGIRKMMREAHDMMNMMYGENPNMAPHGASRTKVAENPKPPAQDMVQCPVCQAYVVKGSVCTHG